MFSKVDDKRTVEQKKQQYYRNESIIILQYLKAIEACCAVGMQLLDLHQTFIYDNLVQIMQGERQNPI